MTYQLPRLARTLYHLDLIDQYGVLVIDQDHIRKSYIAMYNIMTTMLYIGLIESEGERFSLYIIWANTALIKYYIEMGHI